MAQFPWLERFQVDASAFTDSPTALRNLILSGAIPEDEYMKWASEKYKIAVLSEQFFKQKYKPEVFQKWNKPIWNESFFPVHHWRGMLYIACLEPQKVDLDTPHCFVLCSPKIMNSLWTELRPKVAPQNTASQAPASTVDPLASALDFSKLGAQATPETKETPSATPAADVTMTKTITAEDKASADALNLDKLKINPEPEPAPPVLDAPEDSVRIELQTNTTIPKVNENPVSTAKVAPSPKKKEELNLNPKIIKDNKMDVREITQVLNLPNTNPGKSQTPKAKKAKEKELTFTTTKTIMPFPERTTQFTFMRTVYSQQLILEAPNSIKDTKDPQEALMSSFRTLKDYFKQIMWVVRDNKGLVFPIACDSNWLFEEEAWIQTLDFKTKNPFRLAKHTQKPFHGPISRNIASDLFFKLWNEGQYPDHMTVVPVILSGKVFGYFIGCGKGEHFHPTQSLAIMESVCNELVSAFVNIHQELEKVA